MAKSTYKIAFVERGHEDNWRKFWVTNEHTDEVLAAHRDGKLGRSEFVEATNLHEAKELVRKMYPGFVVVDGGSGRIG